MEKVVEQNQEKKKEPGNGEAKNQQPKHRKNYKKEVEIITSENLVLKDQLKRIAAEFDNYKKRIERDRIQLIDNANADLVKALLIVLDDLERSIEISEKNKDYETFIDGIQLVYKNFLKILENQGLKSMQSVGTPFDPEKHEALLQIDSKDKDSNIVIDEHIKGYSFKEKVLRHAKVVVSK